MKVQVPNEIQATNHKRAYALGFDAGFNGKQVRFIHPTVRNSIVRGFLDGERERNMAEAIVNNAIPEAEMATGIAEAVCTTWAEG